MELKHAKNRKPYKQPTKSHSEEADKAHEKNFTKNRRSTKTNKLIANSSKNAKKLLLKVIRWPLKIIDFIILNI